MVDPWTGPPPISNQWPKNEVNGIKKLLDKIDKVALQAKESTSNLLRTAGIRLSRLGMFIDSSLNVGGDLNVSGHAAITGTLSLPSGIIDNDALANPVVPQAVYGHTTGFGTSYTTDTAFLTQTVTVPAGFTSAVVGPLVCKVAAVNMNPGVDALSVVVKIDGTGNHSSQVSGASGEVVVAVAAFTRILTGLSAGGTFLLEVRGNSNYANWAASGINGCELSGVILWLR